MDKYTYMKEQINLKKKNGEKNERNENEINEHIAVFTSAPFILFLDFI